MVRRYSHTERRTGQHGLLAWLAKQFAQSGMIATPPARHYHPLILPDTVQERLQKLQKRLGPNEISFLSAPLYQAGLCQNDSIFAQRELLKMHEGIAPSAIAALCPQSTSDLSRLTQAVADCDLSCDPMAESPVLLNYQALQKIDLIDPARLQCRVDIGTDWPRYFAFARRHHLASYQYLSTHYNTPFAAIQDGAMGENTQYASHGASVTTNLAPDSLTVSDHSWIFRDQQKALTALQQIIRHHRPLYAELVDTPTLEAGAAARLWPLPYSVIDKRPMTALRLVFSGPSLVATAAKMAADVSLARLGGRLWRSRPLSSYSLLERMALQAGALALSISTKITAPDLDTNEHDTAPSDQMECSATTLQYVGSTGRFTKTNRIFAKRDFVPPLQQWVALAARYKKTRASLPPPPDTAIADSDAWQAIRDSLLGPDGQPRSLSEIAQSGSNPDKSARHFSQPSSTKYG